MHDEILIEERTGEYVMKASFDDEEFYLKFYGNGERVYSITLFPDCLVPLKGIIESYLTQARFSNRFDQICDLITDDEEGKELENP